MTTIRSMIATQLYQGRKSMAYAPYVKSRGDSAGTACTGIGLTAHYRGVKRQVLCRSSQALARSGATVDAAGGDIQPNHSVADVVKHASIEAAVDKRGDGDL